MADRQTDRDRQTTARGSRLQLHTEQGQGREQAALRDRQVKRDRGHGRQADRQTDIQQPGRAGYREQAALRDRQVQRDRGQCRQTDRQTDR